VRGWTALTALLAPAALAAGYLYAVSATPGFDPIRQPLSDLGAESASTRWAMTATLGVIGLSLIGTAVGLRTADIAGRWLLGAGGFMLVALAWGPNHVTGKFTLLHTLGSEFAFVLLALSPAMSCQVGPRVPWPLRRGVGVAVSAVVFHLLQLTLWGLVLRADTDGIRETVVYVVVTLWPLVLVAWLMLRGPGSAVRTGGRPVATGGGDAQARRK
jgi:hypothetical membrane protein